MSYYMDPSCTYDCPPPPGYSSEDYLSSSGYRDGSPSEFSVGSWIDDLPPDISKCYSSDFIPADFDIPTPRRRRQHRKYCFVWPKDGRNGDRWGRMKDIATGRGPDMFVVSSPDVNSRLGMPNRGQWTQWNEKYPWAPRDFPPRAAPWAQRNPYGRYDFRRRRYGIPDQMTWTNAHWPRSSSSNFRFPLAFQQFNEAMF